MPPRPDSITGVPAGQLPIRLHLPGVVVRSACPACGREVVRDLGQDYLVSPRLNVPDTFWVCCPGCEHAWTVPVVLRVGLELQESD